MKYKLRPYQEEASRKAVEFFLDVKRNDNAIIVASTGCGKSLIIADIAFRLDDNVLVMCPSKEILQQNFMKMRSYDVECSMFSASVGQRDISKITFCSIGSVIKHPDMFAHFKYIIVDECHCVNPKQGMYKMFFERLGSKVLGLTATPYRLKQTRRPVYNSKGEIVLDRYGNELKESYNELRFLTRTRPRIFSDVLYVVQTADLLRQGFLANVNIYSCMPPQGVVPDLFGNTPQPVKISRDVFVNWTINVIGRLRKVGRHGILVFVKTVEEAEMVVDRTPGSTMVTGHTSGKRRTELIEAFKNRKYDVMINVGTLTTGFDYPELDTVVMARPTNSLALYYQIIGRLLRPYKDKDGIPKVAWYVDECGNERKFGKVEDMLVVDKGSGKWVIESNGKQLTNVLFKDE